MHALRQTTLTWCGKPRSYGGRHGGDGAYQNGLNGGERGYDEHGRGGRANGGLGDGGADIDIDASIEATDLADL